MHTSISEILQNTYTTSVQFHLSMRIFSKGSHPVSFRSFSCRLRYIVHDDDGLRVLLSASVRGIIILSTKSYDAYVFVREVYNIQMLKYG